MTMDADLRNRVLTIYRQADAEVAAAGPVCQSSGRCCRFSEFGHSLFLCQLEAEALLESSPSFNAVSEGTCPFQKDNLCTAREQRPLGCRVYFCDPSFKEQMPVIMEAGIQRLKQLTDETGRPWRYLPLHVFLREALLNRRETTDAVPHLERSQRGRINLI